MNGINVAIAGIGNCSSALVQGVNYYTTGKRKDAGLMSKRVGRYDIKDIKFVAAIDVNSEKIGCDLSDAILVNPNNTPKFSSISKTGVIVEKGPLLDGLGGKAKEKIPVDSSKPTDISELLRESGAEIFINLLPTGANRATKFYAKESLKAGCAFINATPTRLASDPTWQRKYISAKLQLVGDDIKNQIGSTILHEAILRTLSRRGVSIDESYQLDIGGGMESLNALEKERYWIKRKVKKDAVSLAVPYRFPLVTGSSDYVEFMKNTRTSHFWIKGKYFGQAPFTVDMTLDVVEAPACAAVLVDVIRAVRVAKDRKIFGAPQEICAYAFKMSSKPLQFDDAAKIFDRFLLGRRN